MKKAALISHFWVFFFVLLPLGFIFVLSFLTKGTYGGFEWKFTWENYSKALDQQSFFILFKTFSLAFFTALVCTVLAGICAAFIEQGAEPRRQVLRVLFLVPFFINSLIRLFSLQNFLGVEGPVQAFLRFFQPDFAAPGWTHNAYLMLLGMVLSYLPFALLPLIAAFEKWDTSLTEAAYDLGASSWMSFWKIKWPELRPAFLASFIVVLVPALGEYLVPEILEGARNLYWGQYITEAFLKWRNWPLGAALGVLLLFCLASLLFLSSRLQRWIQRS